MDCDALYRFGKALRSELDIHVLQLTYGDFDVPVPEHIGGKAESLTCDLAIIGGGGAGLTAAVRAAELGAKVVLIEKMSVLGGNTRLAGGLLCTNSKSLMAEGLPDATEEHINTYRRHHLYQLDKDIYERFIRNTGRFYDWIIGLGIDAVAMFFQIT